MNREQRLEKNLQPTKAGSPNNDHAKSASPSYLQCFVVYPLFPPLKVKNSQTPSIFTHCRRPRVSTYPRPPTKFHGKIQGKNKFYLLKKMSRNSCLALDASPAEVNANTNSHHRKKQQPTCSQSQPTATASSNSVVHNPTEASTACIHPSIHQSIHPSLEAPVACVCQVFRLHVPVLVTVAL